LQALVGLCTVSCQTAKQKEKKEKDFFLIFQEKAKFEQKLSDR
jgi:hypothetical protein